MPLCVAHRLHDQEVAVEILQKIRLKQHRTIQIYKTITSKGR
jgi:hypothetical protein